MKLSRDLSNYHHPLTKMFKIPASKKEWEKYKLSEEQVAFFNENGYVSGIKLLDEEQVEQLNAELAEVMDPAHPKNDYTLRFYV